jgi:hypothetical protein
MPKFFKILLISSLLVFTSFVICSNVVAQSDSGQATPTLQVTGECNNNGICEPELGETADLCPTECGCNNNDICESQRGEDRSNCLNDCPSAGGGDPAEFNLYITNLEVNNITFDSAEISWETNRSAMCSAHVGTTTEYEKETILETEFSANHLIGLIDLSVFTSYHFNVVCKDSNEFIAQSGDKYFTTLSVIENVKNFTAVPGKNQIFLSWENPDNPDFDFVRLVKNENFYPLNINDGTILYEGNKEAFLDFDVKALQPYYYTIFAKGKTGSWSSGAVATAVIIPAPVIPPVTPPVTPPVIPPVVPIEILKLSLKDFDFYSEGVKLPLIDEKTVNAETDKNLIISVAFEKIPAGYKLIAELKIDKNTFSYIFSANKENTVYNTSMITPDIVKNYPLTIKFYNEENNFVYELNGELSIFEKPKPAGKDIYSVCLIWFTVYTNIFLLIIFFLLLLVLFLLFLLGNKKEKEETEKNNNLKYKK